ncbi:MAG: LuxR C-terminal-related transcriptional regulator [Candidatus Dormibacteria bacterium]
MRSQVQPVPDSSIDSRAVQAPDLIDRLDDLQTIVDAIGSPRCTSLLLSGAAGVGKTRLAREAVAITRREGLAVLETIGSESAATVPLGIFGHLLPPRRSSGTDSFDRLAAAHAFFARQSTRGRTLLLVDNSHLVDNASASVINHLAVTGLVFVLIVLEAEAPLPDAIRALINEESVVHLSVSQLDERQMGELMNAWSGGPVSDETRAVMTGLVDGDLVLLRELIRAATGSDGWSPEGGVGHWNTDLRVTERLSSAVDGRLADLTSDGVRALEVLAMVGSASTVLLESVVRQSVWRERRVRRHVAFREYGRRREISITPPLVAEVLRRRAIESGATMALRDVANTVTQAGGRRAADAARVAVLRLDAGLEADGAALGAAALDALHAGEFRVAERLAAAAVSAGVGATASITLAQALIAQRRPLEAEECLAAVELPPDDDAASVELLLLRWYNLSANLGKADLAAAVRAASDATIARAARVSDRAAVQSVIELTTGRPLAALRIALPLLERDESSIDTRVRARAVASWALPSAGRSNQALELLAEGRRDLDQRVATVPFGEFQLETLEWDALWFAGRLDEAEALAWAVYRKAVAARALHSKGVACFYLGLCSRARGRVRTAVAQLDEALALTERYRPLMVRAVLAALSQSAAIAGDADRANEALDRARVLPGLPTPLESPRIELSHAWLDALAGSLTAARARGLVAADLAASHGLLAIEALALHDVARFGDATQVATRLQLLGERTEGELVSTWSSHVAAASTCDPVALDATATRYERMGYLLLAAEASVQAASAYRANRRPALFRASRDRAFRLASACEGAVTPALRILSDDDTYDVRVELTPREREVGHLASTGLTNREIAALLGVSSRTVDNLLHRAFEKLEVRSRAQLAEVFGQQLR